MNALVLALALAGTPASSGSKAAPTTTKAPAPAKTEAACKHGAGEAHKTDCGHDEHAPAAPATSDEAVLLRGEKIKGTNKVELTKLLASPADVDGKEVYVEGTVRKACSRKGCWMELAAPGDAKGPGVRVTFKDYGFFVPLDSAGRTAKVEGTVKVAALSDELAKHYESEGATVPKGKDGKPREVQLVATGVELRK
jgi:hypothetical protein